jgi:hypothetical protein
MTLKLVIQKLLGEKLLGMLDYYRFPKNWDSWGGAFNDQEFRKEIFRELMKTIAFSAIVETGTFRGATTGLLHEASGLPVYTVELNPRYYGYAKARFLCNTSINLYHSDSRIFLNNLLRSNIFKEDKVFFYLDAHWRNDLPLAEELQIIFKSVDRAAVMIDDFKVPGDDGYGYDSYGTDKVLSLEYLRVFNGNLKMKAFFPSESSKSESGKKRGSVVLAKDPDILESLKTMDSLAPYDGDDF